MAGEPDNLMLLQFRKIRQELSSLHASVDELRSRVVELETREIADGSARNRHEMTLAELRDAMERIELRMELRDAT